MPDHWGLRYPKLPQKAENSTNIDIAGIFLYAGMMVCLLLFLMKPEIKKIPILIAALVLFMIFILYERKIPANPFISIKLLVKNKPLLTTYFRALLTATALYCFIYGYTLWLQDGRNLSPGFSGFTLLPTMAVSVLSAYLYGKTGKISFFLILSNVLLITSSILILTLSDDSSLLLLLFIALLVGLPQGVISLVNQNAVYIQADSGNLASSTGLLLTFQYTGAILAASINGIFFKEHADTEGLHHLGVFLIIIAVLLLVLTIADPSIKQLSKK